MEKGGLDRGSRLDRIFLFFIYAGGFSLLVQNWGKFLAWDCSYSYHDSRAFVVVLEGGAGIWRIA